MNQAFNSPVSITFISVQVCQFRNTLLVFTHNHFEWAAYEVHEMTIL